MRKFQLLFALTLCIGKVDAQIPKNAVSLEDAMFDKVYASRPIPVVKGKLRNISLEELKSTVITCTLVTPFSAKQVKNTAAIAPDGSFEFRLDYPLPYQQIWLSVGDLFFAGVYANTDLFVDIDVKKLTSSKDGGHFISEGVTYLGTDGPMTTYLNRHILFERKKQSSISDQLNEWVFPRRKIPTDSTLSAFNQLYQELHELDRRFIETNPSPYAWMVENERMSKYCAELCLIYNYARKEMPDSLWQKVKNHKSYIVSNDGTTFYSYMSSYLQSTPGKIKPPLRMVDFLALPDLTGNERITVDSILLLEKNTNAPTDESKKLRARIQQRITRTSLARIANPAIRMFDSIFSPMKADLMKLQLFANYELSDQKLVLESFILPSMHTIWPKTVARAEFAKTNAKLKEINNMLAKSSGASTVLPGKALMKTSFGASMYKISKMPLSKFLADLKASLPGKAIIIDRWATWCAPCISEMPHSKTLSEESKDLPVAFVYLCTENNSSESAWKTKVGELKQPGIHYFIDQAFDNEISSYFSFSGYPGYAFIDTKGKYKPGAIQWMSSIDKTKLTELLK
ncbi:MAG: TlpA family protein disulfide reductase [Sediminibacterium sp.]|nr:TlpA family protein disulfide reductase [Sediminibacterium sp.]